MTSGEQLFSLEGDFGNEVSVKNAVLQQVATVVVGDDAGTRCVVLQRVTDPLRSQLAEMGALCC